jgi:hypothetical protein
VPLANPAVPPLETRKVPEPPVRLSDAVPAETTADTPVAVTVKVLAPLS